MKKKSRIKLLVPELLYPYSPVAKPMPPPPVESACDKPRVSVEFSCSLVPYLLGLLELYRYKDSFTGTDEQKTMAVGIMRQLMEQIAMSGCGCDEDIVTLTRINPETGEVEVSNDDGVTWTPDPESPYIQATIAVPLAGENGDVKRCEGANNIVESMQDLQAQYSEMIGQVNTVADLVIAVVVAGVALLFLPFVAASLIALLTPLFTKAFEVARFLSVTTQPQYDALFTNEVWTTARCILYCHISPNGSYSAKQWKDVQSDLKAQLGATSATAGANLASMVDVWGRVGLNNAARIGSGAEGNCDDCPCDEPCDDPNNFTYGVITSTVNNPDGSVTFTLNSEAAPDGTHVIRWKQYELKEDCCEILEFTINTTGGTPDFYFSFCTDEEGTFNTNPVFPGGCLFFAQVIQNFALQTPFTATFRVGANCT